MACIRFVACIMGGVLQGGDRLSPTATLIDVGLIDEWAGKDLPKQLVFWRRNQTRVLWRNPVFDESIDAGPQRMIVDSLHALNLGSLNRFAQELVWVMMWSSVWCTRAGRAQAEWMALSCQGIRTELKAWESDYMRSHPDHKHTEIQKLTPAHFEQGPTSRNLKMQAAETKYVFYFLHSIIGEHTHKIRQGNLWHSACNALERMMRLLETLPWNMSLGQQQEPCDIFLDTFVLTSAHGRTHIGCSSSFGRFFARSTLVCGRAQPKHVGAKKPYLYIIVLTIIGSDQES